MSTSPAPGPAPWYDISPPVSPRSAVFPGDTPFTRELLLDWPRGDHLALSSFRTTVHVGAHADAPLHYHPQGEPIDRRDPLRYLGPCQVVRVDLPRGARVLPADVAHLAITAPRVLFCTRSFEDPETWRDDFNSLSPELIHQLAGRGVTLVGLDTPSVDPADSKALESHQALYATDLAVLEGLVLSHVPEGHYVLVAPPLRLEGAEGAPLRALLLSPAAFAALSPGPA